MKSPRQNIGSLADELVSLLDEEIELLDVRRIQLAALMEATLSRDDDALDTLLDEIEQTQNVQIQTDAKLSDLRHRLADALGWTMEQTRLAGLARELPGESGVAVGQRRRRIVSLAERLKQQHMSTAIVLSECTRINRLMLESLLPTSCGVTTYGAHGESSWGSDMPLVDVES